MATIVHTIRDKKTGDLIATRTISTAVTMISGRSLEAEMADKAPASHVGATGTAHGIATTSVDGFMSSTDKTKLDNHIGATGTAHGVVTTSVDGFMSSTDKTKLNACLSVKATSTAGEIDKTATAPTATNRLNYNGYFYATKVYNAVYNDYAEYFAKDESSEPGDIIELNVNGDGYILSSKYASKLVRGVHSDTYGHLLGGNGDLDDESKFIPIGLAGRVRVKIKGKARKGQYVISSDEKGIGIAVDEYTPGCILGQIEENKDTDEMERVWMFIMRI